MKKIKIVIIILLICIIGFETYNFLSSKLDKRKNIEDDLTSEKIDNSKYLVNIFTPYQKDNIDVKFNKESDNLYYYLIDGLLDKSVQNTVNKKIKETANILKEKYKDKIIVGGVYSNFENTLSYVFESFYQDSNTTLDDFIEHISSRNEDYYYADGVVASLNFDLNTGRLLTLKDFVKDKTLIKEKLLNLAYAYVSTSIGFIDFYENPNPDYGKIEDSILSIMNKFESDNYIFYYNPGNIYFEFNDVYIYAPVIIADEEIDTKEKCLALGNTKYEYSKEASEYMCIDDNHYDTNYKTYIELYKLIDDLIIYDKFKSSENIYKNPSTQIARKFTFSNEDAIYMVETDKELIDYEIEYYGDEDIQMKLYNDVIKESKSLETADFNIYNITGNYVYLGDYDYIYFDVYHYNLDDYEKYKRQIYSDKYNKRCNYEDFIAQFLKGYDYLEKYLTRKAYYYYIYDNEGNQLKTRDMLSDTFDFSTIIPNEWVQQSNYRDLEDMLENAYIIFHNDDFKNDNRLVIYDTYQEIYIKYKGQKIVLASGYDEIVKLEKQIYR